MEPIQELSHNIHPGGPPLSTQEPFDVDTRQEEKLSPTTQTVTEYQGDEMHKPPSIQQSRPRQGRHIQEDIPVGVPSGQLINAQVEPLGGSPCDTMRREHSPTSVKDSQGDEMNYPAFDQQTEPGQEGRDQAASTSMPEPSNNICQDVSQIPNEQVTVDSVPTDVMKEFLGGDGEFGDRRENSPTPVTEYRGDGTSNPEFNQQKRLDQDMHDQERIPASGQIQEPLPNIHQDGQPLVEPICGSSPDSIQCEHSPTPVKDCQGDETSNPSMDQQGRSDQDQHEKEEIWDSKTTHSPETGPAKEIDDATQPEARLLKTEQMLQEKDELIHELTEELRRVNTKYEEIDQLLRERSEELSTAQQFLGNADTISPTEVASLVEMLNAEIAQQSNVIFDFLAYQKLAGSKSDLEHALKWLRSFLGPWLCNNLSRRLSDSNNREFNDLVTQLALQTGLVNACKDIINYGFPPCWKDGMILNDVYSNMSSQVGQAIAGRWRAISSAYLDVDREAVNRFLREVTRKLITAVGGSSRSLPTNLREKLDEITGKVLEIHRHVRSSLTSMDLEVSSIPCGTQFDASRMEDSDGSARNKRKTENDNDKQQCKVMCTVEMGLLYKKMVSSGEQGKFNEEKGVVLKPKVVLDDMITGMCSQNRGSCTPF